MAYKDLRQYIQRLEEEGLISQVNALVDWDLEIGGISRKAIDMRSGALLFNNIKDYPGARIMANILGPGQPVHSLFSVATDHPKDTPVMELIDWFARGSTGCIRPTVVDSAPCKENILKGKDIDLFRFPVPKIHGIDGGRYIGTWHLDVTKDPDTGWVNWGMYRHQLLDERSLGWLALPAQHGPSMYYRMYEARGEPMPMAIVIGPDPLSAIVASLGVADQTNEVDVVGALQGKPVELVKCETIDLEVPANAEIVLEGHVLPGERVLEGPFGEFTGYSAGGRAPRPVFKVECVTHRNDPIFTMSNMGKPWDDFAILSSIGISALLGQELKKRGIPFHGVYSPPPCVDVIVSAKSQYSGFIHSVTSAIWGSKAGIYRPHVYLVGEDVDPTNLDEVFWCLATRLHPYRGIHVLRDTPGVALWPFLDQTERTAARGARVALDATFPPEWPSEQIPQVMDYEHGWPPEIREKVNARWKEYGI